jgi:hypothetical protein
MGTGHPSPLSTNNDSQLLHSTLSASRSSRARFVTPSSELTKQDDDESKIPTISIVLGIQLFNQHTSIYLPQRTTREVFNISTQVQQPTGRYRQVRVVHNQEIPNPHGRKRFDTRSKSAAIAGYLKDPEVPQDNRAKPWRDKW